MTALVGAFATLAAVRHAERTGEGQTVDVNLLQSMFQIMGPLVSAYAHMGYLQPRLGSGIPYTVPRGTYRCADGVWVASSSSSDNIAHAPARADRPQGRRALFELPGAQPAIAKRWRTICAPGSPRGRSTRWCREFRRVDAAIAKVYDMKDIFADPHFKARDMITEVDGVVMQNVVANFSKTPGRLRHAGRPFGADNENVLGGGAGGKGEG